MEGYLIVQGIRGARPLRKKDGKYFTTLYYLQTINFMALKKFLPIRRTLVVEYTFFVFFQCMYVYYAILIGLKANKVTLFPYAGK
jgi:hypothetical protein